MPDPSKRIRAHETVFSPGRQKQFHNIPTDKKLRLNKEIPTITGATLSAKSIVDGSRLAFAFYEEMLKGK